MIGWRCRLCSTRGYDTPGLAAFWAHWTAYHQPQSIWDGAR